MSASVFVDRSIAKQFECSICLDIYEDPVQIECEEHIYCKKCVDKLILTQGRKFKCPLCQRKCNAKVITRVKFIDRQINDLKIICPNAIKSKKTVVLGNKINNNNNPKPAARRSARLQQKTESDKENNSNNSNKISGRKRTRASIDENEEFDNNNSNIKQLNENESSENCEWKGLYSDLNKHISVCPLEAVKCKYCSNSMLRQVLDKHYHTCPRYPMNCIQCGKTKIYRNRMPCHIEFYCQMTVINCVRCNGEICRKDAKVHLKEECPEFYIQCPFYKFGCQELLKRKDFQQHIQNAASIHNHLEKMANHQTKLEETVNELQSKNNELNARMTDLQNQNVALNTRLNNLEQQIQSQNQQMQTQQQQHHNSGYNGSRQRQSQMNVSQNNQLQQQYSHYTEMLQQYGVMLQQNPSLQQDKNFMTEYANVRGAVEQLQQQLQTRLNFNNMPYFGQDHR